MTLCTSLSMLMGCTATRKAESSSTANARSPDQQSVGWTTTPLPIASEPVAVKEGAAPLVYLVESPGAFRIHDRTTGQDLAQFVAAARSIVRIDGRTGVVVGGETLVPGPLDRDHRYVIYRDPTGPNMARQGVFQVPPPPRAKGRSNGEALQDRGGRELEGGPHVDR